MSNRLCNKHSPVVEVVYLTCQHKPPLPTHVRIDSAGRCSTALCEQITSVDVSRLGDYKGHLIDREMAQVDTALMASLELHPLARQAKVEPIGPHVDDSALALIALRFLEGFLQNRSCAKNVSGFHTDLSDQKTVEEPCYSCIDLMDLSSHRPNAETEFASFTPATEVDHAE